MTYPDRPTPMPEDDYAPIDYTCVPSVSEGRRLEQMKKMHRTQGESGPITRRRAQPQDASDDLPEYRVHPVRGPETTARDTVMRRLPTAQDGPAPAQRVAYPPGYHHEGKEDYGLPEDPFHPPVETQQPTRRRVQPSAPAPEPEPEPSPAPQEIPDWLRVAQQNNMPLERPQAARAYAQPTQQEPAVQLDALGRPLRRQSQPRPASPYETAGYPEALLQAQRELEQQQAAQPIRRRHGAQYAVKPQYTRHDPRPEAPPAASSYPPPREAAAPAYAPPAAPPPADTYAADGSVYAPPAHIHRTRPEPAPRPQAPREEPDDGWHVENDEVEPRQLPAWLTRVPWLGIAAFASVLAAVVLWILGTQYQQDLQLVLAAREAQELAIADKHPLKYESLIDEKAYKYNLSPAFVAAIMLNESSFRPDATASSTGARGLMQLMDETAQWVHGKLNWPEVYNFDDLYTPEVNAEYGCWYLNYLSQLFQGDPILVAAAYHAGQNEVQNWLNTSAYSPDGRTLRIENIPFDDTRRYVTRVMGNYAAYKRLYYGG